MQTGWPERQRQGENTRINYNNNNHGSLSVKEKKCIKKVQEIPEFHDNKNYDNKFSNTEDDDDYNNEDLEQNFYLSSKEDDLFHEFVQWQKSIDGGNRAERQAQKHMRKVMSIV